jgi:hypothetical protein
MTPLISTLTLNRIETKDPYLLHGAIELRKPMLVRGLTSDWPASNWDLASLRKTIGEKPVKVLCDMPRLTGALPGGQDKFEKEMLFTEFVDRALTSASPCYLGYVRPE